MSGALDRDVCPFCGKREDPHVVMSCIARLVDLHHQAVADIREVELERNKARDEADALRERVNGLCQESAAVHVAATEYIQFWEYVESPPGKNVERNAAEGRLMKALGLE